MALDENFRFITKEKRQHQGGKLGPGHWGPEAQLNKLIKWTVVGNNLPICQEVLRTCGNLVDSKPEENDYQEGDGAERDVSMCHLVKISHDG